MTRIIARLAALIFSGLFIAGAALADETAWRKADPENILLVETDRGRVLIELSPRLTPRHAAHMKALTREGFFDNRDFYRVVENFVVQVGSGDDMAAEGNQQADRLVKAELTIPDGMKLPFTPSGNGDVYAAETGFYKGFPIGRDPKLGLAWIAHCPGIVGMARNDDPDSGGTDWYAVTGQSPRHLDRNITTFGRVIYGMDALQAMPRGPLEESGMIPDGAPRGKIERMRVLADLPEGERPTIEIMKTDSAEFRERIASRRKREGSWFIFSPPVHLDVCTMPIPSKIAFPAE